MPQINNYLKIIIIIVIMIGIAFIAHAKILAQTPSTNSLNFPLQTVEEAGGMSQSASSYWWLNSGALFTVENSIGKTIQGTLPIGSKWQQIYSKDNPVDTDDGLRPQNIFRLVSRNKASNFSIESNFQINANNFSNSPNRNASNGLLFMGRYIDGNNLYYCGVRVDGLGIIKRKYQGNYTTLLQKKVFQGSYSRNANMSLLPQKTPLGVKCIYQTYSSNKIKISLFYKQPGSNSWSSIGSVIDTGTYPMILYRGYYGIRTDFMDIQMSNYSTKSL